MISLRPYQQESLDGLRQGFRDGHQAQLLVSPTGSGKTVIAASVLKELSVKQKRAALAVDRVALVGQTSNELWRFGIQHGVVQGKNTIGRNERIQVVSAQSIEKRDFLPQCDLLMIDEAHCQRKWFREFIQQSSVRVIGLTATPFTAGLGKTYTNLVNVTSTYSLIETGYLAPLKVYAAKEIDMTGAPTNDGEWSDQEVGKRGTAILGDCVAEWEDKTQLHFGGPVKTIAFSATVAHGEEMCRKFQAAGYNFQQISYRNRDDEHRSALIEEFRKRNSDVVGLVSCEALAKGFDVPDIRALIAARPYRKSLASHIQQIGRAMRSAPGKDYALLLDHSGNYLGFFDQMDSFFRDGARSLDPEAIAPKVRKPREKIDSDMTCSCGCIVTPDSKSCPGCGKERVQRNRVQVLPGQMVEVGDTIKKPLKPYLQNAELAWQQICHDALRRKGEAGKAKKFALAQYRNFYGEWPGSDFDPAASCDPALARHIQGNLIRFAKRRKVA